MVDNADGSMVCLHQIPARLWKPFFYKSNDGHGLYQNTARTGAESLISEFNYAILQAYDFCELRRRYGCALQMGGSDQWGNIVTGIDLTRRVDGQEVFGLTSPLITTASGAKMGKSAAGAVWLNEDKLLHLISGSSGAQRMQMLVDFCDCLQNCLKLTLQLEALEGSDINLAKITLANAATTLCHGKVAADAAEQTARQSFSGVVPMSCLR